MGARAVNVRFGIALDFDVYTALPVDVEKVCVKPQRIYFVFYGVARKACDKAQSKSFFAKFAKGKGNVNTLSAYGKPFVCGTVDNSAPERD